METMEKRQAIEDLKMIGETYASMYDEKYKKVAAQAFIDGMQFFALIKNEQVTDDMVSERLFRKLREAVDNKLNGRE